ncbi:MAG: response regulator [Vicinamibacterales bacterium]
MSVHSQTSVLVVDDNAATRYSTGRVLRSVGHAVLTAGSGTEAITVAVQSRPDIIVLDINLPDIDGFQVCRELRARAETHDTPIVYLSATFVDDLDKVQGLDAGADGYLTHPVEPPVLISTISALLRARRAEHAIVESEARLKAVFENALNGIALLSDDMVVLDLNPAMCGILGRDRQDIVGRHLSVFSFQDHPLDTPAMRAAIASTGQWRGVAPVLNAAGRHVDLEWSVSLHSVPNVHLAIVSDITERVAAEADRARLLASERQARAQAEEANRVKDDFLAALSHELRTPLNAIVGFSRVLQTLPVVAADGDAVHAVNAIERNAWVQAQLISDLLDVSRITSGKLDLDRQPLSPVDAVEAALTSVQGAARAKKIRIETALDPQVDQILWDPSRFQQVVWNLVDNAVKFSDVGGAVHVTLGQTPTHVELRVRDTGRGISPEFLPHVFDRFRQQESTSRRGHGGLGLGLAIVHQLVSAHGGTIEASSDGEGHGATFVVTLPRHASRELTTRAPDVRVAAPVTLHGVSVMVVDDNEDARTLLRRILADASARVLDVMSAKEAMGSLDGFRPDILVSDLAMPGEDGFDLIRQVRSSGWSAMRLPAIALSAYARDDDRQRSLQAGFQSHMSKPPDVTRLLRQIATLTGRRARET